MFFTRGVSLKTWAMMGNLDREIAIYKRFVDMGCSVDFVTYGNSKDLEYSEKLGGIGVLCNEADLPLEDYERRLESLHVLAFSKADIFKTNQIYGGELALRTAEAYGKPLIARCGYMWSLNAAREHGFDSQPARFAREVERTVFNGARRVIVTTDVMEEELAGRIPEVADRIRVVPNYVDTDVFSPDGQTRKSNSLLFVGRIAGEKNLDALLEAVSELDVELTLVGEGRGRPDLQAKFSHLDGRVKWEGNVPNSQLPTYMNGASAFVLPSLYEGHPKALLEAMSCGTPVIGCDSPGIREIIENGENGLLCPTDPHGLRTAIQRILGDSEMARRLGASARAYVINNFSLDRIFETEWAIVQDSISGGIN